MNNKKLIIYIFLAYLFSWIISVPLAINYLSGNNENFLIHYLTAFGPLFSAIVTTYIFSGLKGLKDYFKKFISIKLNKTLFFTLFSPVIFFIISAFIALLLGESINLQNIGKIKYLDNIGIVGSLFLWIFTFGIGEESGWRGFALVELQKKYSFKLSTVILSIIWFCWHIPFFIYNDNLAQGGFVSIMMYGLSLFSGTVVLSFLFNKNGNAILPVAIWHGVFNWVTASEGLPSQIPMIMSIIVVAWAIFIWQNTEKSIQTNYGKRNHTR